MKIITFVSGKGGSGKTVLIANLGAYVAKSGYKVLLVDWDFFTRGLSYYILEGMEEIENTAGLMESFENDDIFNLRPHNVRKNLDIIVPSKNTKRIFTFEDILKNLTHEEIILNWDKLSSELRNFSYDFVFIDTHSGTEFLSLAPTFFSDNYVIVCEEDRTSWRVSTLVKDTISKYSYEIQRNEPQFGGFILNQTIGTPKGEIIRFLEKEILLGKCISTIHLNYKVRKAFAEDKLVIESYPNSSFTRNIRSVSKKFLKVNIPVAPIISNYLEITSKLASEPYFALVILLMYI